jgi:hypothetical protein
MKPANRTTRKSTKAKNEHQIERIARLMSGPVAGVIAMTIKMPEWMRIGLALAGLTGVTSGVIQYRSVKKVLKGLERLLGTVGRELDELERKALHVNRRGRLVHA